MGWCDDISFPKKYNKLIKIKKNYEKLKKMTINMIFNSNQI